MPSGIRISRSRTIAKRRLSSSQLSTSICPNALPNFLPTCDRRVLIPMTRSCAGNSVNEVQAWTIVPSPTWRRAPPTPTRKARPHRTDSALLVIQEMSRFSKSTAKVAMGRIRELCRQRSAAQTRCGLVPRRMVDRDDRRPRT